MVGQQEKLCAMKQCLVSVWKHILYLAGLFPLTQMSGPEVIKLFFIFNSDEHEIYPAQLLVF